MRRKEVEKGEKPRFYGFFLSTLPFSPWAIFAYMAAYGRSSENTRKVNLILVLNKTSPWAHTKSELEVLGVARKLVEYVKF
jgi:hypothetical protein